MNKPLNENSIKLRKKEYIFFLFLFILLCIWNININPYKAGHWKSEIRADKSGYYVYLPAFFLYNFDPEKFPEYAESITGQGFELDTVNNKIHTKYTYGVALLHAPFFFISHIVAKIEGKPANGFSQPYFDFANISAIFYMTLGLLFLYKFLLFYFNRPRSFLTTVFILTATNLLYYGIVDGLMSHAFYFFLYSLLLFALKKYLSTPAKRVWFLIISLCFAIILIVRPINIIFAGLTLLLLDIDNLKSFKERIKRLFEWKNIVTITSCTIIFLIPQLLYWRYLTGSLLHYSYEGESFINRSNPKLLEVLFSTNNGLFLYTPVYLLFLAGIIFMIFKKFRNGLFILLSFMLLTYISASWWSWNFGCAFSHRNFIDLLPLLALGLGYLFTQHKKFKISVTSILVFIIAVYFSFFNISLIRKYDRCAPLTEWDWKYFDNLLMKSGLYFTDTKCYKINESFENAKTRNLSLNPHLIIKDQNAYSGSYIAFIDSGSVHGTGYRFQLKDVCPEGLKRIKVRFKAKFNDISKNLQLAININDPQGNVKVWHTLYLNDFSTKQHEWISITHIYPAQEVFQPNDILKIYILNPSGEEIAVDNFNISLYENNYLGKLIE